MVSPLWNISVLGLGSLLLFGMAQLGGVAVELLLLDLSAVENVAVTGMAGPQVKSLMRQHGVQYFDWNEERREYGFWRHGQWCPAVNSKINKPKPVSRGGKK